MKAENLILLAGIAVAVWYFKRADDARIESLIVETDLATLPQRRETQPENFGQLGLNS